MIVKIWPIKADYAGEKGKVGGVEGIKNTVDYVQDEEKVLASQDNFSDYKVFDENDTLEGSFINSEEDFSRVVNYMTNEDKTKAKYVSQYLCATSDITKEFQVAAELLAIKSKGAAKPETGAVAFHLVQSFPENLNISDEEVHECGLELVKKLGKYQALICSHLHPVLDEKGEVHGKCKHNHILINAYMHPDFYDPEKGGPRKYNDCIDSYRQLQIYNDEIAIEHGLPIIREADMERTYSWKEIDEVNKGTSWKERARMDIEMVRRVARDWNDFVKIMKSEGYEISEKKHITYTTPNGKKARGDTLGKAYTKQSLEIYWAARDHARQRIKGDLKENHDLILSDFIYHYGEKLSVKIPLGPQFIENRQFAYLTLDKNVKADEEALRSYMKMGLPYDICDESGHPVMAATGLEIMRSIEDLRDVDLMARRETVRLSEEEIREARRKRENEKEERRKRKEYYENKDFKNTRTGDPYRASLYDENGRRRSTIELMFILALIILDKEEYLWIPKDIPPEQENEVFFASTNWKIQRVVDSIELSRQEGLETPAQLQKRLDAVGADLSRTKKAFRVTSNAKERMDPLAKAIAEYKNSKKLAQSIHSMPDGPEKAEMTEKYADVIEQYKAAKRIMYANGISDEAGVIDFDKRYDKIKRDVEDLEARLKEASEHYRRLKKLNYSIQLAEDPRFIYGPSYPRKGYTFEKEKDEEEPRKRLWDKASGGQTASGGTYDDGQNEPTNDLENDIQKV